MRKTLRVLMVEDVEPDAELLALELRRGGYDVVYERVDTATTMASALEKQAWDLVISDYAMPHFSAPRALELMKEYELDLPFIIVSGTVDEEAAVEAIRAGAHDFMAKGRFARLIPAIERELRDAELRLERSRMREQLLISDRMASLGTLAAGVAHEVNNPLATLMANLDFASEDLAELLEIGRAAVGSQVAGLSAEDRLELLTQRLPAIDALLREARESSERVRLIVRDLKIFSRSDDEKTGPVDVQRVLESSLRMSWNEVRHRAKLVKDYTAVPLVQGNEARLGQVFLNLIVNAAQAIPEGNADQHEIRIVTRWDQADHVSVEIWDDGAGIAEAALSRIFDPFFTTKPIGTGTGLGLAICHRIVTALGGQIQVESEIGKGTTVRTLLPVATSAGATLAATPEPVAATRKGKVLVVDDEPALAVVIKRMLAARHEVVAVSSATEAFELFTSGERFDVILCDLMMPEMTGMDLHAKLSELVPQQAQRMIFMTGGAFTARARDFLSKVPNPRLEKPFELDDLRARVESTLNIEA